MEGPCKTNIFAEGSPSVKNFEMKKVNEMKIVKSTTAIAVDGELTAYYIWQLLVSYTKDTLRDSG